MKKQYSSPRMEYWAFCGAELCVTTNPLKLGQHFTAPTPPIAPGSGSDYHSK